MADAHAHQWRITAHYTSGRETWDRYLCTVIGCPSVKVERGDYSTYLARNSIRGVDAK